MGPGKKLRGIKTMPDDFRMTEPPLPLGLIRIHDNKRISKIIHETLPLLFHHFHKLLPSTMTAVLTVKLGRSVTDRYFWKLDMIVKPLKRHTPIWTDNTISILRSQDILIEMKYRQIIVPYVDIVDMLHLDIVWKRSALIVPRLADPRP